MTILGRTHFPGFPMPCEATAFSEKHKTWPLSRTRFSQWNLREEKQGLSSPAILVAVTGRRPRAVLSLLEVDRSPLHGVNRQVAEVRPDPRPDKTSHKHGLCLSCAMPCPIYLGGIPQGEKIDILAYLREANVSADKTELPLDQKELDTKERTECRI